MRTALLQPVTLLTQILYSVVYEAAKTLQCNYGSALVFHRCDRLAWRCIRLH